MSILRATLRVVAILVCFSTFPILLGWVLGGWVGMFAGGSATALFIFLAAFSAERVVIRSHAAEPFVPKGLLRSLELVAEGSSLPPPRVCVYADPSPNVLVIRSIGSKGVILLSQGLISLLSEEELRSILHWGILRLMERGILLQSLCSVLAVWVLKFAPKIWVSLVFTGRSISPSEEKRLGPISALHFLIFFPMAEFLFQLGRPILSEKNPSYLTKNSHALQKVAQSILLWGTGKRQGAYFLYLLNPASGKMLFPYR